MILAKVIGTVWGAKQCVTLQGRRVISIRPVSLKGAKKGQRFGLDIPETYLEHSSLLAVDPIGADIGQLVLVSIGSRVRDLVTDPAVPTKHCVIAIVDEAILE
jgi:microcompartment protein CcmK/EutM